MRESGEERGGERERESPGRGGYHILGGGRAGRGPLSLSLPLYFPPSLSVSVPPSLHPSVPPSLRPSFSLSPPLFTWAAVGGRAGVLGDVEEAPLEGGLVKYGDLREGEKRERGR
jgi:hypothetical protein